MAYILDNPTFKFSSGIDFLIGGAIFPKIMLNESHSVRVNMSYVMKTVFGYMVLGPRFPDESQPHCGVLKAGWSSNKRRTDVPFNNIQLSKSKEDRKTSMNSTGSSS